MRFIFSCIAALSLVLAVSAYSPAMAAGGSLTGSLVEVLHNKGVLDDASYNELKAMQDESGLGRRLMELLHEKGVLDDASYDELSAGAGTADEKTAVAAGEAMPAAEPKSSPAPSGEPSVRERVAQLDKGLAAVEEGIARLGRDDVSMKISFFFQGGWVSDTGGFSVGTPPTSDVGAANQFFLRRARIYFDGNVLDKIGYKVSFETATSGSILRDAYIYLDYIPHARLTLGQFKVPFGLEGVEALAKNPTINRSMVTNFVHAPTLRDRGVMLSGKLGTKVGARPLGLEYYVGVFDGNGFNKSDDNDHKDVVARVLVNPMVEGLDIGGSWYKGRSRHTQLILARPVTTITSFDKDRDQWAAELDYDPPFAKGLKLRGEYIWARKFFPASINPSTTFARHAHTDGWYALAAYRVNGLQGFWRHLNGLEPVVRYEFMDEDTAVSDNERTRTTVGLNYYLAKDTRIMANYEFIRADSRLRGFSLGSIDSVDHDLFTALFQLKF